MDKSVNTEDRLAVHAVAMDFLQPELDKARAAPTNIGVDVAGKNKKQTQGRSVA